MKTTIRLPLLLSGLAVAAVLTSCTDTYSTSPAAGYRTGQEVRDLPEGALTETVNGTRYYSYDGTYYRPDKDRYVVVEPPEGRTEAGTRAYVDRLPPGYHMKTYAGEDYFEVGNTWYKQYGAGYIVIDRPF